VGVVGFSQRRREAWAAELAAGARAAQHRERWLQAAAVWVLWRDVARGRALAAHFVRWRLRHPVTTALAVWRAAVDRTRRLVASTVLVRERRARNVLAVWSTARKERRAEECRRRWLLASAFAALHEFRDAQRSKTPPHVSDVEELPAPSTPRSTAAEPRLPQGWAGAERMGASSSAPSEASASDGSVVAEETHGGSDVRMDALASSWLCCSVDSEEEEEEMLPWLSPHQWRIGLRALAAWKVFTTFRYASAPFIPAAAPRTSWDLPSIWI
jgi:hypothetical protein